MSKKEHEYSDLSTVQSMQNDLAVEEFPEGSYGMSLPVESLGKSTPWTEGQRSTDPFGYENKSLHHETRKIEPAEPVEE